MLNTYKQTSTLACNNVCMHAYVLSLGLKIYIYISLSLYIYIKYVYVPITCQVNVKLVVLRAASWLMSVTFLASALEVVREFRWWFPVSSPGCSISALILGAVLLFLGWLSASLLPSVSSVPALALALHCICSSSATRSSCCQRTG